ncbi:MAG: hypothetical protein IJP17_04055, partial [Clostridia bacterium]|nr:hypothetical protein [Clostridia bacterium]
MNILIITSHYPSPKRDNRQTLMAHYFAKEWVKCGHRVCVIHAEDHFFTERKNILAQLCDESFEIEGVTAIEVPCARHLPRLSYVLPHVVRDMKKRSLAFLKEQDFIPDVIVADFCVPLWGLARALRCEFSCKAFPIFHNCDLDYTLTRYPILRVCNDCEKV